MIDPQCTPKFHDWAPAVSAIAALCAVGCTMVLAYFSRKTAKTQNLFNLAAQWNSELYEIRNKADKLVDKSPERYLAEAYEERDRPDSS